MLTNVIRLMGAVKSVKAARGIVNRPTIAVLPLSPNHGLFGNDGLYSESKAALEGLSNRSISEGWSDYISVVGAVIGWCRSTGLMSQNDLVAEQLEKLGLRTFSSVEMAFNLLGCLHPLMMSVVQIEQVVVDLAGGLNRIPDLAPQTAAIRAALNDEAARRRAIALESSADFKVIRGAAAEKLHKTVEVTPRANFRWEFPSLGKQDEMSEIARLAGQGIDLNKVIVCTGFAEVSPWGSARTRWEYEVQGSFTIEGCIELAWIMGLVKFVDGKLPDGTPYVGWVDAKSQEPVTDAEVKARYEKDVIAHSGIRLIEPELFRGYNPDKKQFLQEIEIQHDLEPVEVSSEDAAKYRLEHGDKVDIWDSPNGGSFMQLKRGARINVPQAIGFSRTVAGQIPTGWSGRRFGIPEDIVSSVDRVTLWALVAISDALVASGITDPYEIYKYVHPSRVGTALGSGMGGTESLKKMFTDRRANVEVQNDILQETFINTVAGWANLLLLSSSGPIVTPVGACATALQSINIASEAILSGKADIMIAGGYDDLSEEGSFEFANMKATSDAHAEAAAGREPSEMSRPTTTTRSGFMESQGLGTQIIMSAATAIRLGCPIQSVVAYSSTHTDKQGRSIPAPGHGVMSAAPALQRALAEWGLNADDIGAISIHGTSTKANDKNESHCYNEMFRRMGRTPSLAVPVMAQKWMVGHLKGGAAALATNALMQSILSHTVAGNRNADDISPELRQFSYLLYASQTIKRTPRDLNAGLLTSFGFGQVGGIVMLLHPNHLLARLSEEQFSAYASKRAVRQGKTYSRMHSALTRGDLVRVKDAAPYTDADMDAVLMNPNARAREVGDSFAFVGPYDAPPAAAPVATFTKAPAAAQKEQELSAMMDHIAGVGIDAEDISSFPESDEFRQRNFTAAEISYCSGQPDARASFAGRWAAKEAIFKAMGVASRGGAAPMKDIEILASPEGPKVNLTGDALAAAPAGAKFLISITHSSDQAVAIAHRV